MIVLGKFGEKRKWLNLYFNIKDQESMDFQEDFFKVSGIINARPKVHLKEATVNRVQKLSLKILWLE